MATKEKTKAQAQAEPAEEIKEEVVNAPAEEEERVYVTIPYVEGEDPEQTVIVNGRATKIRKGVQVAVPLHVANVVKRSNRQAMIARENQEKMKLQKMDL